MSLHMLAACLCAVAACILLPATASAAACANANLTPSSSNVEQVRAAVVCLINQERERHGERTLQANVKLARAAQGHSRDMADEDYFSHIAPNGETPLDRMRASGYIPNQQSGYVVGENIAWGTMWLATPQSIVKAWMESPGHRANILDGAFRETGVGVEPRPPASLAEGQPGALYTQDFGTIVSAGHAARRDARDTSPGRSSGASGQPGRHSHPTHHRRRHHKHRRRKRHRRHRHHDRRRHRRSKHRR